MKYATKNILNHNSLFICAIALLALLSITSCRAKRETSRNESYTVGTERLERRSDSIHTVELSQQRAERSGSEVEQSYTRITEFDTTGTIQRVSETWRDRQLSNLDTEERTGRTVSVTQTEQQIVELDTSYATISETSHTTTDSRPVQGVEWIWVILSVVLIATVIIYIIYNRRKIWQ